MSLLAVDAEEAGLSQADSGSEYEDFGVPGENAEYINEEDDDYDNENSNENDGSDDNNDSDISDDPLHYGSYEYLNYSVQLLTC